MDFGTAACGFVICNSINNKTVNLPKQSAKQPVYNFTNCTVVIKNYYVNEAKPSEITITPNSTEEKENKEEKIPEEEEKENEEAQTSQPTGINEADEVVDAADMVNEKQKEIVGFHLVLHYLKPLY